MNFLLDTDICSAHLKGNSLVTKRFLQYSGGLAISAISRGELWTWALRAKAPPKRRTDLEDFLTDLFALDTTTEVAEKFGEVQAGLLDAGICVSTPDLMIASTALV